jgi:hypothetical protein
MLSSRPMVFVGLISYPLYLWHWPLLSYAHIVESGVPSGAIRLGAVALSFLLAWMTYRIVEKPVRATSNYAALILAPCLILTAGLGLAVFSHRSHARSEAYGLEKIIKGAGEWDFPGPRLKTFHTELGYYGERGEASRKVLFLGDSNMEQYYPRIDKLLTEHPDTTKGVIFVTQRACPPIPYVEEIGRRSCAGQTEMAFFLAQDPAVDTVVIAASWSRYAVFVDPENRERSFHALETVIDAYRTIGRRVYLILPIPNGEEFDPYHLIVRSLRDFGFKIARTQVDRARVVAQLEPFVSRLKRIAVATGATTIDPVEFMCGEASCPTLTADGSPLYMDDNHLRLSYVRDHVTFLDAIVVRGKE